MSPRSSCASARRGPDDAGSPRSGERARAQRRQHTRVRTGEAMSTSQQRAGRPAPWSMSLARLVAAGLLCLATGAAAATDPGPTVGSVLDAAAAAARGAGQLAATLSGEPQASLNAAG